MSNHSALPWTVRDGCWIEDANKEFISAETSDDDAEFIVVAVNQYEEMYNLLCAAVHHLHNDDPQRDEINEFLLRATMKGAHSRNMVSKCFATKMDVGVIATLRTNSRKRGANVLDDDGGK